MSQHTSSDRATWLCGGSAKCSQRPAGGERPLRVILLGAPGVGKGTQAALLSQKTGACHLSTGDVFREAKTHNPREQTLGMSTALNFMRKGALVPEAIVWQLVRERAACLSCPGGFVLDGFPRTLAQAGALKHLLEPESLPLDAVINYELPAAEIISRLSGRRTCANCKAVFHLATHPPRFAGVCDHCGGVLYQREDDRPEAIAVRLQTYQRSTAPLIDLYGRVGLLTIIDAAGEPEKICLRTLAAIESRRLDANPEQRKTSKCSPDSSYACVT